MSAVAGDEWFVRPLTSGPSNAFVDDRSRRPRPGGPRRPYRLSDVDERGLEHLTDIRQTALGDFARRLL